MTWHLTRKYPKGAEDLQNTFSRLSKKSIELTNRSTNDRTDFQSTQTPHHKPDRNRYASSNHGPSTHKQARTTIRRRLHLTQLMSNGAYWCLLAETWRCLPDQGHQSSAKEAPRTSETYKLERIIKHEGPRSSRRYLVKCRGYAEPTWEPIDDYHQRLVATKTMASQNQYTTTEAPSRSKRGRKAARLTTLQLYTDTLKKLVRLRGYHVW